MKEQDVKLRIYGMSCEDCAVTISKGLRSHPGVSKVEISLREGIGKVTVDPETVSPGDLLKNEVFSRNSHYKATIIGQSSGVQDE